MSDELILVDLFDRETGSGEKLAVHRNRQLHRAFSVFIRDGSGRLLLQRRARGKYHSGGLWANACCSHPRKGESRRRRRAAAWGKSWGFRYRKRICGSCSPLSIMRRLTV